MGGVCQLFRPSLGKHSLIQVIGRLGDLLPSEELDLRRMADLRVPASAIAQKAISIIHRVSDKHKPGSSVGKKINIARLDRSNPCVPVGSYASNLPENTLHLLDMVDLRTGAPGYALATSRSRPRNLWFFRSYIETRHVHAEAN